MTLLMNKNENKKLLLMTRLILFAVGFTIGFLIMWQVLSENPTIVKAATLRVCFYLAAGLFLATILALSAKPVYLLFYAIGTKIRTKAALIKATDIAGVMLGVLIGVGAATLANFLLGLVLDILALRTFIVIIVAIFFSYLAVVLCVQWLKSSDPADELASPHTTSEAAFLVKGYLIHHSAFSSENLVELCKNWLVAKKYVVEGAENMLDEQALANYKTLTAGKIVDIIPLDEGEDRHDGLTRCIKQMNLRVIVLSKSDKELFAGDTEPLVLENLH